MCQNCCQKRYVPNNWENENGKSCLKHQLTPNFDPQEVSNCDKTISILLATGSQHFGNVNAETICLVNEKSFILFKNVLFYRAKPKLSWCFFLSFSIHYSAYTVDGKFTSTSESMRPHFKRVKFIFKLIHIIFWVNCLFDVNFPKILANVCDYQINLL